MSIMIFNNVLIIIVQLYYQTIITYTNGETNCIVVLLLYNKTSKLSYIYDACVNNIIKSVNLYLFYVNMVMIT